MNVFACDPNPKEAAIQLADRHVIKMTLETAQILSTVVHAYGLDTHYLYKPTHRNHPIVTACVLDSHYLSWVAQHGLALANEYLCRFDKHHASSVVLDRAIARLKPLKYDYSLIVFPLAMPVEFKCEDPHLSYRNYLRSKYLEWNNPKWTRANPPAWMA